MQRNYIHAWEYAEKRMQIQETDVARADSACFLNERAERPLSSEFLLGENVWTKTNSEREVEL